MKHFVAVLAPREESDALRPVLRMAAEPPRRRASPGLAAWLAFAMMATSAAPGQAQVTAAQTCAQMPSQAQEIACLREALEQALGGTGQSEAAIPEPAPQEPVLAPEPVPLAAQAQDALDLGREQVAADSAREERPKTEPQRIRSKVAAADVDPRGYMMVRLENGQTWRQAERAMVPMLIAQSDRPVVEIVRSGFGGYRMFFPEQGKMIVVRRVE